VTVIYPISLLELLEGSELERFLQVKKTLQAGDILEGRVIKLFNQAEALIDFGSFRARAQVQLPLSPGELLKVMVIDAGEKIHFQIQNPEKAVSVDARALSGFIERNQWIDLKKLADFIEQVAEKISPKQGGEDNVPVSGDKSVVNIERQILDRQPLVQPMTNIPADNEIHPVLSTVSNLKNLLRAIDAGGDAEVVSSKIASLLKSSGIFWENRVLTLALSQAGENELRQADTPIDWNLFRNQLETMGKEDVREQMNVLVRQLKEIENSQKTERPDVPRLASVRAELETFLETMLAQHKQILQEMNLKQEDQAIFSFNLPFEQAKVSGKMKVYLKKKGKGRKQKEGWRISLLLDLSRIGGVRVDLFYLSQILRLSIFVGDRVIQNELMHFSPMLVARLKEFIESVHVEILVSKAKIDHFETEDWVDDYSLDSSSVDIKV